MIEPPGAETEQPLFAVMLCRAVRGILNVHAGQH